MNKSLSVVFMTMVYCLHSPTGYCSESAKHAFGLNIAAHDSAPLRVALDSALKAHVNSGRVMGPIETEWYLGQARLRDIQYNFIATVPSLKFTDNGIDVTAQLHNFTGTLQRIEFNAAGTSYCENIPVNSNDQDVFVHVRLNAAVNDQGEVHLIVKSSQVLLDSNNFQVGSPNHCNVLSGFNWLVSWLLPTVVESYRDAVATQIGRTMAKSLQEIGLIYSPYLAMNITLPVHQEPIRPFYARLSVAPQDVKITKSNFATWFASDIDFDPDFEPTERNLAPLQPWPVSTSHLAVSWDFLNAVLKEANLKGVISGFIKPTPLTANLFASKILYAVWPELASNSTLAPTFECELDGAQSLKWERGSSPKAAVLRIEDLQLVLKNRNLVLARLHVNFHINVGVNLAQQGNGTFTATTTSIGIDRVTIDPRDGILAGKPLNQIGLRQIIARLEGLVKDSPIKDRKLIEFATPDVRIGSKVVKVTSAEFHDQGLLLPIRLTASPVSRR